MRAFAFPFDTCWLIKSIRLSLFISFSWDWGLTSVTSRMAQAPREHQIRLDRTAFGFQDEDASAEANATWTVGCAVCVHLCLARGTKRRCLLHGGQETRELVEANRMQMLVVWEKGMWKEEERADEGMGGDNKLFANQATMRAIALLDWMQQARVFQPDYWSMWTHIFPAMGEETVMTKPMPLPRFFPFTVPSCSSSVSLSHPVLISVLFVLALCLALSFVLIVYNTRWHYFPLSKWKEKHLGDVQSRLAVKSFEHLPPFREILIENPGSGGTTGKLEMCELEMKTDVIWYAATCSFLKNCIWITCLNMKNNFWETMPHKMAWEATFCCDVPHKIWFLCIKCSSLVHMKGGIWKFG